MKSTPTFQPALDLPVISLIGQGVSINLEGRETRRQLFPSGRLLPVALSAPKYSGTSKPETAASPSMKKNDTVSKPPLVIVVDDSASIRNSTQRLVRSFGFATESFASADEFLQSPLVNECGCLILDVRMPRMDGLELQRHLAESHPLLPIVFFTAHGNEEEQQRAMEAGAVAFLRKPVTAEILLGAIREALRRRT